MKISKLGLKLLIERYLLFEHNKNEFIDLVSDGSMTQDDYNQVYKSSGQPKGIFRDSVIRKVLYNTFLQKLGHGVDDFIDSYSHFKQKIIDPYNRNQLAPVRVPGTSSESIDLASLLQQGKATYDDFQTYTDISGSTNARSKVLQRIIDEGFAGSKTHFEVIYENHDWIVCYPKTYQGSIAIARMGPDKRYYTPPKVVGRINWCTSIDSGGNMFLNYHRHMNLHMYYITKKAGFDSTSVDRKLCLSFNKRHGETSLSGGNATVNANNAGMTKEAVIGFIQQRLFDLIKRDAEKPERKEINIAKYYKSVSFEQYTSQRKIAASMSSHDYELFKKEIDYYVAHTTNTSIINAILNDEDIEIRKSMVHSKSASVLDSLAVTHYNVPQIQQKISYNSNSSAETINNIFNNALLYINRDSSADAYIDVLSGISRNSNTQSEILEKLADPSFYSSFPGEARSSYDFIVGSAAGNVNTPDETIEQLVDSNVRNIKTRIANSNRPLKRSIMLKLSKDRDKELRKIMATRDDTPVDIMLLLYDDNDIGVSKTADWVLKDLAGTDPFADTLVGEEIASESGMTIDHYDPDGNMNSEIWKLVDDLYRMKDTFSLERKFDDYIKKYKDIYPELDDPETLQVAIRTQKGLNKLNKRRSEYSKFVKSGKLAEMGFSDFSGKRQ